MISFGVEHFLDLKYLFGIALDLHILPEGKLIEHDLAVAEVKRFPVLFVNDGQLVAELCDDELHLFGIGDKRLVLDLGLKLGVVLDAFFIREKGALADLADAENGVVLIRDAVAVNEILLEPLADKFGANFPKPVRNCDHCGLIESVLFLGFDRHWQTVERERPGPSNNTIGYAPNGQTRGLGLTPKPPSRILDKKVKIELRGLAC